jgi:site-specific recombinase XerD
VAQHYQRNVISIFKWCEHCGRKTAHRVDDKRVENCMSQHSEGLSKKQEAKLRQEIKQFQRDKVNSKQPNLFGEDI